MRRSRHAALLVSVALACAACGGSAPPAPRAPTGSPALRASGPPLPPPAALDPAVRGAPYLAAVAAQLQPAWAQFLEDCRLRLPAAHPLNAPALAATIELVIAPDGHLADARVVASSGNGDFDTAVFDVLADRSPLPPPPPELESDDALVHVRWMFARDRRQAGPATARVVTVELPLGATIEQLLARGAFARAATRAARAPASAERDAAATRVMTAAIARGLASRDGAVRVAALEAVARAQLHTLAPAVHRLVTMPADPSARIAAIEAAARLGDPAIAPALVGELRDDLAARPALALAKVAALAALGRARDATPVLRAELADPAGQGHATALAALAHAPDPELAATFARRFARADGRVRESLCAALPAAAPARASAVIARGLRDGDAGVRASCVDAAARQGRDADRATVRRLGELARDRDRAVRARAIAALGTLGALDPAHRDRALGDPAPEVRAAAARGASEAALRALAGDRDPEVRAVALGALGDRAADLATAAIADPAPAVRLAAIARLADDATLARLAGDPTAEVATAALVRYAAHRGRAAVTSELLARVAEAPAGGVERVRIALAWLLAR